MERAWSSPQRAVRTGSNSATLGLLVAVRVGLGFVRHGLACRLRVLLALTLDGVRLLGLFFVALFDSARIALRVARFLGPGALRGALRSFASAARRWRVAPTPAQSPRCRTGPDARSVAVIRFQPPVRLAEAGQDSARRLQVWWDRALSRGRWGAGSELVKYVDEVALGHSGVVEPVDLDEGGLLAGAEAFLFVEGDGAVGGDGFGVGAEEVVGSLVEALGAEEGTGDVGADGHDVAAGGAHAEHRVEGGHGLDLGSVQPEELADLPQSLACQVSLRGLDEVQEREHRGAPLRVAGHDGLGLAALLVGEHWHQPAFPLTGPPRPSPGRGCRRMR